MQTNSKAADRPKIVLACSDAMYARAITNDSLARLQQIGVVEDARFEEPSSWTEAPPYNAQAESRLIDLVRGADALIIGPGAPRVTASVLDAAPSIRFIGELEGDRFGRRIDMQAASKRGIKVVDTTQGSSDPVAEWSLGLMLIGLRNAGDLFRRLIAGEVIESEWKKTQVGYRTGELSGKRIGIIGCGFIGRRLIELLSPFRTQISVHDPMVPRVLADVYDFALVPLDKLFAESDVIVCTLPLTQSTQGLIGAEQFRLMRSETVFVNVGRGAVVDTDALTARLEEGDIVACLDVHDPEPIPANSPLRSMYNVFLSPHIAGVTEQCGPRFVHLMADELVRHFAGEETRFDLTLR